MSLPLSKAPSSLCLLRLSAIGDVKHYWPETKITWIIGRLEHQLVCDIEGIEFIVFDKSQGLGAYKALWLALRHRSFDVFLHMQVSLRSNIASLCVKSSIKLGFDRARAKDFQWLFTRQYIRAVKHQHVLDGFFEFLLALGVKEKQLIWDIPIPAGDAQWASDIAGGQSVLVINPSSSQRLNNWRNWPAENYVEFIEYAVEQHGLSVVLTGGPAENEVVLADSIITSDRLKQSLDNINNLVGKTSLKQLAAIMQQSCAVVAPDTGPAHIANALGRPVIGLYASSNPKRTGPYSSAQFVVNQYPAALLAYENVSEENAPWGKRIRHEKALHLITVDQVKAKLDQVMAN